MKTYNKETEPAVSVLQIEKMPAAENIRYIEADGNSCWIYTADGRKIFDNKPMKQYETNCREKGFYRIHHKYLINTIGELFIERINDRKWIVILNGGTKLEIAYKRKDNFLLYLINTKSWNINQINELFVNNSAKTC